MGFENPFNDPGTMRVGGCALALVCLLLLLTGFGLGWLFFK